MQTPLTPDKPHGSVLDERAVRSRVWKLPRSARAALDTLSLPRVHRRAWSHLSSKPEWFAVSKRRWMNLGLSWFTLWRIRPKSGVLPTQLPSSFAPAAQVWSNTHSWRIWARSAQPHCYWQRLSLTQKSTNSEALVLWMWKPDGSWN